MIGLSDIKSALKKILSDKVQRWLNVQIPITGVCPTMAYTAVELAQNDYEHPKKEKIPLVILEMNKPYPKNDSSHPLSFSAMEEPVFHFRILEKELPDIDSIEERIYLLERRVAKLEKEVKELKKSMSDQEQVVEEG